MGGPSLFSCPVHYIDIFLVRVRHFCWKYDQTTEVSTFWCSTPSCLDSAQAMSCSALLVGNFLCLFVVKTQVRLQLSIKGLRKISIERHFPLTPHIVTCYHVA